MGDREPGPPTPRGRMVFLSVMTGLALLGELTLVGVGLSLPERGALVLGLSVFPLLLLAMFGIPLVLLARRRRSGR